MTKEMTKYFLNVIKDKIYPITKKEISELNGDVFGAALINAQLEVKIIGSNNNKNNPILHGEITTLNKAFEELNTKDLSEYTFISTHEPCPMCASAIAWSGIKTCYYLFTYEDTAQHFGYPEDMKICKSLFNKNHPKSSDMLKLIPISKTYCPELYDDILKKYIELKVLYYKKLRDLDYPLGFEYKNG